MKRQLLARLPMLALMALVMIFALRAKDAIVSAAGPTGDAVAVSTPAANAPAPAAVPAGEQPSPEAVIADAIPTRSLWDLVIAGGMLMIPIAGCSFVLFVFTFERFIALRFGHVIPRPFVKRFLHQLADDQLSRDEAIGRCLENPSHIARVFAAGVKKWGKPAVEVEQAIMDAGDRVGNELRRYLRIINGVSTISPLLGLLGTVWGMITAFNATASAAAMGRPELLAEGISVALITTAAGLIVAIPAMVMYLYFVGRIDRLIIEIDARGQELVDLISAEAMMEKEGAKPKKRAAA